MVGMDIKEEGFIKEYPPIIIIHKMHFWILDVLNPYRNIVRKTNILVTKIQSRD
jgi:hypothetical protein